MDAIALPRAIETSKRVRLSSKPNVQVLVACMSKYSDIKKLWEREELTPQEKFEAYLEGYTMSFDFYPVCERHLFAKNDAYAIWQDFTAVSADINSGIKALLEGPEPGGSAGDDDTRRRKVEATRKALEAIKRAHAEGR